LGARLLVRALQVANGCLFVAGNGKICVFNTSTLESLGSIGQFEFSRFSLNGVAFNNVTQTLWVTARGLDLTSHTPTGLELIASVQGVFDQNGTKIPSDEQALVISKLTHFASSGLFPNSVSVESSTGAFGLVPCLLVHTYNSYNTTTAIHTIAPTLQPPPPLITTQPPRWQCYKYVTPLTGRSFAVCNPLAGSVTNMSHLSPAALSLCATPSLTCLPPLVEAIILTGKTVQRVK
jgi:hypothetical protein